MSTKLMSTKTMSTMHHSKIDLITKLALKRFPIVFLLTLVFCLNGIFYSHNLFQTTFNFNTWGPIFLSGMLIFLNLKLFNESQNSLSKLILKNEYFIGIPIFLLISWYFYSSEYIMGSLPFLCLGLLVLSLIAPFLKRESKNDQIGIFNFSLYLRTALSSLFVVILGIGICAILASVGYLFELTISINLYLDIWILICFFLFPVLFISNIPIISDASDTSHITNRSDITDNSAIADITDSSAIADITDSSEQVHNARSSDTGLRWIGKLIQYVAVPLLLIYSAVLYGYCLKILVSGTLPKGQIAYLVSGFGIAGIFCYLTISCLPDKYFPKTITLRKMTIFFRKYFLNILWIPLILLGVGIGRRVYEYGITVSRYSILLILIWFLLCVIFGSFCNKKHAVKFILGSLAFLLIMASVGPWSAVHVSALSQKHRFEERLVKYGLLINGTIVPIKENTVLSKVDREEIISSLNYLLSIQRIDLIRPWFLNLENSKTIAAENSKTITSEFDGQEHEQKQDYEYMDNREPQQWRYFKPIMEDLGLT